MICMSKSLDANTLGEWFLPQFSQGVNESYTLLLTIQTTKFYPECRKYHSRLIRKLHHHVCRHEP